MKRITIITFILALLLALASTSFASAETVISVDIDGSEVVFDESSGQPFIDENDRTQVPFRKTLEAFGATVDWDSKNKTAIAEKNGITVLVPIGADYIYKNGEKITNDTKSLIKNGRTYLPIRIVLEAFWADVSWEAATKTVIVSTADAMPLMWLVTAPDGQTMYLFGSIHCADEALYPLPAAITNAFESCDYLAVEFDTVAFEKDTKAVLAMASMMVNPDGKKIADIIGSKLYKKAKTVLKAVEEELELGFSFEMLDYFNPFVWEELLGGVAVKRAGLSYDFGLDNYFLAKAHENGMGILEVESAEEQMTMLLGFSLPLQVALLESSLDLDLAEQGTRELYRLWKKGDLQEMEAFLTEEDDTISAELSAEYMFAMLTKRNIKMAEAAERYMAEKKAVFYVVGLGHMLGEDGIVELLKQNGYIVVRI